MEKRGGFGGTKHYGLSNQHHFEEVEQEQDLLRTVNRGVTDMPVTRTKFEFSRLVCMISFKEDRQYIQSHGEAIQSHILLNNLRKIWRENSNFVLLTGMPDTPLLTAILI